MRRSAVTHTIVLLRFRDVWNGEETDFAFAKGTIDRYRRDGTNLFQFSDISEQSQFAASRGANNSDKVGPSGACSGEEEISDTVVLEKPDKEDWDLDEVITATEADGRGL